MHILVRHVPLTVAAATAAVVGISLAALYIAFAATGATVPPQSLALTLVLPVIMVPVVVYPLLWLFRRQLALSRQLERQAHTDILTGLPNRRAFFDFADVLLVRTQRSRQKLAAMTIDVDHFKEVNDRFGHDHGDMVLKRVAGIIRAEVSESKSQKWIAARIGGEEFAVLTTGLVPSAVGRLAERICNQVQRSVGAGEKLEPVTVSVGVAFHAPGMKIDRLLKLSDDAVYEAKRAGRDRWAFAAEDSERVPAQERAAG